MGDIAPAKKTACGTMCAATGVLPRSPRATAMRSPRSAKTRFHAKRRLAHAFPTARQNTFPCKKSTLHMQFYRYAMHYKIMVDFALREYFNREQFITEETVDAEITVVMPVQRIHGAEMWIRNKLSNGPLRA